MRRLVFASLLLASLLGPRVALAGDGTWNTLLVPFGFASHCAVFDSIANRVVAFGGSGTANTWQLDLTGKPAWTRIVTTGSPPPQLTGHSAILDPVARRMIVFGGGGTTNVWALTLDGAPTWSQLATTGSPPPATYGQSAIYDSQRRRMIIFGGYWSGFIDGSVQTVYALDLNTLAWSQFTGGGAQPGNRYNHSAIYDPVLDRMIVWSGEVHGDAFRLDLSSLIWTRINSGPLLFLRSAFYDHARRRMVATTGAETWAMSLTGAMDWTQILPAGPIPTARQRHAVVYDPLQDRLVMTGGDPTSAENWALPLTPGAVWSDLSADGFLPPCLGDRTVIFDSDHSRAVLFGGRVPNVTTSYNDVWTLPLVGAPIWSHAHPTGTPPSPRYGQAGIYDPAHDRLLVFGGNPGSGPLLNDLWELALGTMTWTQLFPTGSPPSARWGHTAVYDPAGDRMVVFGGFDGSSALRDTWTLNLTGAPSWTPLAVSPPPFPLYQHSAIMDVPGHRMLVFGGNHVSVPNSAIWSLSLDGSPAWVGIFPGGAPLGRLGHTAIFDSSLDRMVIWGGCDTCTTPHALELSGTPTWRELAPTGTSASGRSTHQALYDPLNHRMLILGGSPADPTEWELRWDAPVTTVPGEHVASADFALRGLTPNPAGSVPVVSFTLRDSEPASLEVFDLLGRRLLAREVGPLGAGPHSVRLAPNALPRGAVYILRLSQGAEVRTRRAVVIE